MLLQESSSSAPRKRPAPTGAAFGLRLGLLICLLSMLPSAGCQSPSEDPAGGTVEETVKLVVTGSSTVAPLVSDLAKAFEKKHDNARVDVQTGGSSRGMSDARRGLADIGMVSRSPKEGEDDLRWHPIANDGLAIIVHADNPVGALSSEQVEKIYRGDIESWHSVGGNDAPITVVNKAEGRSTLEIFLGHFGFESADVEADVVIGDNQQGIKTVSGNPDAIAYVSIGTAEFETSEGTPIKLLTLDSVVPSTAAVRDGTYPISRTLHLVTADEPEGWVAAFVDYCRSTEAHPLVEGQYFVPLGG
ncbi:MAG: phosphate ABC transporter substrate-binding protein [Acidobacteriota bacterium]